MLVPPLFESGRAPAHDARCKRPPPGDSQHATTRARSADRGMVVRRMEFGFPPIECHERGRGLLRGRQDAELVAVGIGHDDPVDVALAEVNPGRAERYKAVDLSVLVGLVDRRNL